jgi:hypothetical protein
MYKLIKLKSNNFWTNMGIPECSGYPSMPTILPKVKRIIAIGDIHGDYDLAINSLKLGKVIDNDLNWIGNDTIVIQVGDQIDSCRPDPGKYDCHNVEQTNDKADDIKILNFFTQLDYQARQKGGAVYSLLGNHEIMNSNKIFDYVSYNNYYNFNYQSLFGPTGRQSAFKPGGPIATELACTRNSIMIIGSNLFVHAALLPSLVNDLDSIDIDNVTKLTYINNLVRKWLLGKDNLNNPNLEKILFDPNISPFWARVLGKIPANETMKNTDCNTYVKPILNILKIGNLVIGHTPQLYNNANGINGTCSMNGINTVHRVDGGFANSIKIFFPDRHIIQVLEILNDNTYNILTQKD